MNQVHNHPKAQIMGGVDKPFECLGGSEPGRRRKKAGNLVAERSVVGMLLDGHELECVVSGCGDPRQNMLGEFIKRPRPLPFLGHAHMALVNKNRIRRYLEIPILPDIRVRRMPDLGIENQRVGILDHTPGIGGYPVSLAPRPVNPKAI